MALDDEHIILLVLVLVLVVLVAGVIAINFFVPVHVEPMVPEPLDVPVPVEPVVPEPLDYHMSPLP